MNKIQEVFKHLNISQIIDLLRVESGIQKTWKDLKLDNDYQSFKIPFTKKLSYKLLLKLKKLDVYAEFAEQILQKNEDQIIHSGLLRRRKTFESRQSTFIQLQEKPVASSKEVEGKTLIRYLLYQNMRKHKKTGRLINHLIYYTFYILSGMLLIIADRVNYLEIDFDDWQDFTGITITILVVINTCYELYLFVFFINKMLKQLRVKTNTLNQLNSLLTLSTKQKAADKLPTINFTKPNSITNLKKMSQIMFIQWDEYSYLFAWMIAIVFLMAFFIIEQLNVNPDDWLFQEVALYLPLLMGLYLMYDMAVIVSKFNETFQTQKKLYNYLKFSLNDIYISFEEICHDKNISEEAQNKKIESILISRLNINTKDNKNQEIPKLKELLDHLKHVKSEITQSADELNLVFQKKYSVKIFTFTVTFNFLKRGVYFVYFVLLGQEFKDQFRKYGGFNII